MEEKIVQCNVCFNNTDDYWECVTCAHYVCSDCKNSSGGNHPGDGAHCNDWPGQHCGQNGKMVRKN